MNEWNLLSELPPIIAIFGVLLVAFFYKSLIFRVKRKLSGFSSHKQREVFVEDIEKFVSLHYQKNLLDKGRTTQTYTSKWLNNALSFLMYNFSDLQSSKLCAILDKVVEENMNLETASLSRSREDESRSRSSMELDKRYLVPKSRYCRYVLSGILSPGYKPKSLTTSDHLCLRQACRMNTKITCPEHSIQGVHFKTIELGNKFPLINEVVSRHVSIDDLCLTESTEIAHLNSIELLKNEHVTAYTFSLAYETDEDFLVEGNINIPAEQIVSLPASFGIRKLSFGFKVSLVMVPSQEINTPMTFALRIHKNPVIDFDINSVLGSQSVMRNNLKLHALIRSSISKLLDEKRTKPLIYLFD